MARRGRGDVHIQEQPGGGDIGLDALRELIAKNRGASVSEGLQKRLDEDEHDSANLVHKRRDEARTRALTRQSGGTAPSPGRDIGPGSAQNPSYGSTAEDHSIPGFLNERTGKFGPGAKSLNEMYDKIGGGPEAIHLQTLMHGAGVAPSTTTVGSGKSKRQETDFAPGDGPRFGGAMGEDEDVQAGRQGFLDALEAATPTTSARAERKAIKEAQPYLDAAHDKGAFYVSQLLETDFANQKLSGAGRKHAERELQALLKVGKGSEGAEGIGLTEAEQQQYLETRVANAKAVADKAALDGETMPETLAMAEAESENLGPRPLGPEEQLYNFLRKAKRKIKRTPLGAALP